MLPIETTLEDLHHDRILEQRSPEPVAQLSSNLLSVLEQEGMVLGSAIPEATPLRRLLASGSRLDAEDLAQLLRECREQIITDEDRYYFEQAIQNLTVQSSDSGRVPLDRIVQRVGGRLRGSLGGWIVPLDCINESLRTELERSDFPREFPDTTTGNQALAYIRDVWERARSSPERLANDVRMYSRQRMRIVWKIVIRTLCSPNGGTRPYRKEK